ncbi:MAG: hypothetical protein Q8903_00350 [Bacteroidota bacterium]|nr:hypothetical protein [Bacteroidota bacterium]
MKTGQIILVFILIGITAIATHNFWPGKERITKEAITDTIYIPHTVHDSVPGEIRLIHIKEPVNIDSMWEEAKKYAYNELKRQFPDDTIANMQLSNYRFQSAMDTTYQDSLLQIKIMFNSPIPLHPTSYFTYDILYKDKYIKRFGTQPETSFWTKFNYSINCGFGYGIINKGFDFFIGIGGSFNL